MTPAPISTPEPTIEQSVNTMVHDVKSLAQGRVERCERKIRNSPGKAMLIAAASGYCLSVLPTRTLVSTPIRIGTMLVKPALLALGAVKLCEIVQDRARQ